ncbi:MAG: hypothetical protein GY696_30040 [Gammaproteobacteria bacterium]|nr:hypothetical protein [Gammaproteobacteria bacterium]
MNTYKTGQMISITGEDMFFRLATGDGQYTASSPSEIAVLGIPQSGA